MAQEREEGRTGKSKDGGRDKSKDGERDVFGPLDIRCYVKNDGRLLILYTLRKREKE